MQLWKHLCGGIINYEWALIAFTILSVLLSALALFKETTAQTAAGIQPKIVICKIKHIIPVNIFPRRKNENQGRRMAMSVMVYKGLRQLKIK